MYLTKKQVTPVPKYFYGNEFVPPDSPGWYTWVLPEGTRYWTRDWRGAGAGGTSSYGGTEGWDYDSKVEWQDYWESTFGWTVKAISVYVAAGGNAGGNPGGTMQVRYTPYIPFPGAEPGEPRSTGSLAGATGNTGMDIGGSNGSQMGVDYGTVLELGAGGQTLGQAGTRANGGGRNGKGGNSFVRFRGYSEAFGAPPALLNTFDSLVGSFIGQDVVIIKWPVGYRYFDLVFCHSGSGGQGGQAFLAGGAYDSAYFLTQRIDRNNCTPWGYNPQLLFIHLGRPGKGGAIGKVWGGVGTRIEVVISETPYAANMDPFSINKRVIPVSASSVWYQYFNNTIPADAYRTGTQTPGPQRSVTFYGNTYSTGANPGQAPGRSGQGGNGGVTPTRGQDGAPGGVWWNIHN